MHSSCVGDRRPFDNVLKDRFRLAAQWTVSAEAAVEPQEASYLSATSHLAEFPFKLRGPEGTEAKCL